MKFSRLVLVVSALIIQTAIALADGSSGPSLTAATGCSLSGCTFTGAISGTTANFSGNISAANVNMSSGILTLGPGGGQVTIGGNSTYNSSGMVNVLNGISLASIPAYPVSDPTFSIISTTNGPVFYAGFTAFGTNYSWVDLEACGSYNQMCFRMGNGSAVLTALENENSTNLWIGGGDSTAAVNISFKNSGTIAMPATPTSAGSGGLNVCIDTNGVLYKKASCP